MVRYWLKTTLKRHSTARPATVSPRAWGGHSEISAEADMSANRQFLIKKAVARSCLRRHRYVGNRAFADTLPSSPSGALRRHCCRPRGSCSPCCCRLARLQYGRLRSEPIYPFLGRRIKKGSKRVLRRVDGTMWRRWDLPPRAA